MKRVYSVKVLGDISVKVSEPHSVMHVLMLNTTILLKKDSIKLFDRFCYINILLHTHLCSYLRKSFSPQMRCALLGVCNETIIYFIITPSMNYLTINYDSTISVIKHQANVGSILSKTI